MDINRKEVDEVICNIMIKDGPDGHCDGHDVITDFIMAIVSGDARDWTQNYYQLKNIED